jgi:hypothetical protein
MLKELWGDGIAANAEELSERRKRVQDRVAHWFSEFEVKNEVLIRMIMDVDEYASLRLGMVDEFKSCTTEELLPQGKKGSGLIRLGQLWTAEVYVTRYFMEWVELLGDKGTKVQKM